MLSIHVLYIAVLAQLVVTGTIKPDNVKVSIP